MPTTASKENAGRLRSSKSKGKDPEPRAQSRIVRTPRMPRTAPGTPRLGNASEKDEATNGSDTEAQSSTVCPVCENIILDAGQTEVGEDAIYCEGRCKKWFHRCCTGLPKHVFIDLKDSETPFHCPSCTASNHGKAINELRETVQALAAQVEELRAAHSREASSPTCHCTRTDSEPSWVEVVKRKHSHRSGEDGERSNKLRGGSNRKGGSNRNGKQNSESNKGGQQPEFQKRNVPTQGSNGGRQQDLHGPYQLKPIPGKRKVWGTLKLCSSTAVKGVITHLTSVGHADIRVKRKYKLGNGKKVAKWWHVVSGDEGTMTKLEQEWGMIQMQTSWSIESCMSYVDDTQVTPTPDVHSSDNSRNNDGINSGNNKGSSVAPELSHPNNDNNESIAITSVNNESHETITPQLLSLQHQSPQSSDQVFLENP